MPRESKPERGNHRFDAAGPIRYKHAVLVPPVVNTSRASRGSSSSSPPAMLFAVAFVFVALAAGACSRKIGDSCLTSNDCDPTTQTRTCDLSQPGGYCIIEGCDARSCPEDSVCVRFFPAPFLTTSCDLAAEKDADPKTMSGCPADEVCVPEAPGEGVCARRALEKRVCVQSCGGDGDCRGGYHCLTTGSAGALPLTLNPAMDSKYCAPK